MKHATSSTSWRCLPHYQLYIIHPSCRRKGRLEAARCNAQRVYSSLRQYPAGPSPGSDCCAQTAGDWQIVTLFLSGSHCYALALNPCQLTLSARVTT